MSEKEQKYGTIITDLGVNAVFVATTEGVKVNIDTFAVGDGDGAYYLPTTDMVALKNEKWRGAVGSYEVSKKSPNMITVKGVVPTDVGGFTVREVALFSDAGTMIAIANTPEQEKVVIEDGISSHLELSMMIVLTNAGTLNFVVDSSTITATAEDLENHNEDPEAHPDLLAKVEQLVEQGSGTNVQIASSIPEDMKNGSWCMLAYGWEGTETSPDDTPEVPPTPDTPEDTEEAEPDIVDPTGKEVVALDLVSEEMPLNIVIDGVTKGISNVEEQTTTDGTPTFKINRQN